MAANHRLQIVRAATGRKMSRAPVALVSLDQTGTVESERR
jgi:hypothetical protein